MLAGDARAPGRGGPGPEQSSRSASRPRRSRIRSRPASGSSARTSTASARPFGAADEVQAPVDAVGAVDVRMARRPEHGAVAGGLAAEAVARGVVRRRRPRPRRFARRRRRRAACSRRARARPRARSARRSRARASSKELFGLRRLARSPRAACARAGRGRRGRRDPCRRPRRSARRTRARRPGAATRPRRPGPCREGSSARCGEATIGSAIPSTQTACAAPAAVVAADRLERVDLVGARVLAEAEEDHAGRSFRHAGIIASWQATLRRAGGGSTYDSDHHALDPRRHPGRGEADRLQDPGRPASSPRTPASA